MLAVQQPRVPPCVAPVVELNAGLLTLVLGVAVAGIVLTQDWNEKMQKATMGLGGAILVLGVLTFVDPLMLESGFGSTSGFSAGLGVFVDIAGGAYHSYSMDDTLGESQRMTPGQKEAAPPVQQEQVTQSSQQDETLPPVQKTSERK